MDNELKKPLYALTIGEFTQLMREILNSNVPEHVVNETHDEEEYFTISQLSEFLNCSKVTLHNYKNRGLPYYRIGRKLLFKKSEVLDFMKKNVKRIIIHRK
jgi:excisionase family DNA binding protein